ncbi:MAG: S8 family serine peptidase [Bacteroidales bacterium]|nr:S8 family serine peptidase [Bacteroidales bacterium]
MKKNLLALMAASLVCASCAKEMQEVSVTAPEQQTLMTKLVGGAQGELIPGKVLIRMDESSAKELNSGDFTIFNNLEGVKITPALPVQPKNVELARKYGLHRWFTVEFDTQHKPEAMAARLAGFAQVEAVQYDRYIERIEGGEPVAIDLPALTKSAAPKDGDSPKYLAQFNDPYLRYQWNLVNEGTIVESAVEGADVGVRDAWKLTAGDPSVVVAVFDCAVNSMHEDLADALWKNQAEIDGQAGKDDDGNGFIDDKYGFNFVGCFQLHEDYVNDKLDGKPAAGAVKGNLLDWSAGSGHGTHVAGIIGATNNNGIGVSSIAGGTGNGDGVRLMTCQIFEGSKATSDAQSAAAFIYAADNGACIAQCSYGTSYIITEDDIYLNGNGEIGSEKIAGSPLENAALRYFLDPANSNHESLEGNMAIFAAGNHSNPYSSYPGALPYVVSVTAFGVDYLPSGYTNYGPGSKIAAPGGEMATSDDRAMAILSTGVSNSAQISPSVIGEDGHSDTQYVYMQGTSMACPHVSGVVSLGLSYAKKLGKKFTREEFTSMLLTSVNDIDQFCTGTKKYGYTSISLDQYRGNMGTGAVDAWKFLMAIEGTPTKMVKAGEKSLVDLSDCLGGSASTMTYVIEMDQASKDALGVTYDPVIKNGKLEITCSKIGAGKIKFSSAVGKDNTMEGGIGEMEFSRELSIVSRPYAAANGGWF